MDLNEDLFKEFEKKKEEQKEFEDSAGSEEDSEEEKGKYSDNIQIRVNKKWIERSIFIFIIIILLILVYAVYFKGFQSNNDISPISDVTSEKNESADDDVEDQKIISTQEPKINLSCNLSDNLSMTSSKNLSENLSENVSLIIGVIELDADKKRIEYVWVHIINHKNKFTPLLKLYWYGENALLAVKNTPKKEYTFDASISVGETNKKLGEAEGVQGRYLNLEDSNVKAIFKVELYDAEDNKTILDTATKTVLVY